MRLRFIRRLVSRALMSKEEREAATAFAKLMATADGVTLYENTLVLESEATEWQKQPASADKR